MGHICFGKEEEEKGEDRIGKLDIITRGGRAREFAFANAKWYKTVGME